VHLFDLTLQTPAENLALDEALLEAAEAGEIGDVLRLWEPTQTFVVIGRSSRYADEVNVEACRAAAVPILRRVSGGAAIVTGPGCLMYSVIQTYEGREHLRMLDELHGQVLGTVRRALEPLVPGIAHLGTCDLVIGSQKVSGNAVRCKRDHFLYHGTLLYNFDLQTIRRFLKTPPREPDYRQGRSHTDFVTNLPLAAPTLRQSLTTTFEAQNKLIDWPQARTTALTRTRYTHDAWTYDR
jgi:lipoate---protein ligase